MRSIICRSRSLSSIWLLRTDVLSAGSANSAIFTHQPDRSDEYVSGDDFALCGCADRDVPNDPVFAANSGCSAEAARIDGASEWKVFWIVVMPMLKPAISTFALFSLFRLGMILSGNGIYDA